MSKKLIERLLEIDGPADWVNTAQVAAYHIETQQKRIELYEQALKASWPEGAIGDAFDYWNAARMEEWRK